VSETGSDAPVLALPDVESLLDSDPGTTLAGVIIATLPLDPLPPPGAHYPIVAGCDLDLLVEGEKVVVDGDRGTVEIAGVTEVPVVTSLLVRPDGRVLLLKRSERVSSFRGRWAGVSGFLEGESPPQHAIKEIREETGIPASALTSVAEGRPVYSRDGDRIFVVHPFAFLVQSDQVRLDWEHTEFDWVDASEIVRRPTVPKLDRVWSELEAPVRSALGPTGGGTKV
jgi:8-oxo-dGTP diphosphatase